jgi:hypothetical protein
MEFLRVSLIDPSSNFGASRTMKGSAQSVHGKWQHRIECGAAVDVSLKLLYWSMEN